MATNFIVFSVKGNLKSAFTKEHVFWQNLHARNVKHLIAFTEYPVWTKSKEVISDSALLNNSF